MASPKPLAVLLLVLCVSHHVIQSSSFVVTPHALSSERRQLSSRKSCLSAVRHRPNLASNTRMLFKPDVLKNFQLPLISRETASRLKASALAFFAVVALTLGAPSDAFAGRSGGRVGGGSFRAPTQSRQYQAPRQSARTYDGGMKPMGGSTIIVAPRPYISPFSPFGGFSPFGYGAGVMIAPYIGNLLVVSAITYVGYKILTGSRNGELSTDVSVSKIQVAVYCPERTPSSLLGTISRLANQVDTEDEGALADFVSDVSLALLRRENDWISFKVDNKVFGGLEGAEDRFSQLSLKERAKIERETYNKVKGRDRSEARQGESSLGDIGKGTAAVITILVATKGKALLNVEDRDSLRSALSSVGSELVGRNTLMAAEVMWTPEEPWETVTPDDLILDYPDLIPV